LRIAILDCCCPNPPELAEYGPVGDVLADWLRPHLADAVMRRVDVWGGERLPAAGEYDGVVVSGSEAGVYDDTAWMAPLRRFLLEARAAGKPVLGICFGHQLMADTYGGKAERAPGGYAAGAARFDWQGEKFDAFVLHGDQVTEVPPGAVVTCAAPHCPVGGLAYDFPAMSFQFHPEYDRDYVDRVTGCCKAAC
jgi:GMP synthase-like glutamine amidotransferase